MAFNIWERSHVQGGSVDSEQLDDCPMALPLPVGIVSSGRDRRGLEHDAARNTHSYEGRDRRDLEYDAARNTHTYEGFEALPTQLAAQLLGLATDSNTQKKKKHRRQQQQQQHHHQQQQPKQQPCDQITPDALAALSHIFSNFAESSEALSKSATALAQLASLGLRWGDNTEADEKFQDIVDDIYCRMEASHQVRLDAMSAIGLHYFMEDDARGRTAAMPSDLRLPQQAPPARQVSTEYDDLGTSRTLATPLNPGIPLHAPPAGQHEQSFPRTPWYGAQRGEAMPSFQAAPEVQADGGIERRLKLLEVLKTLLNDLGGTVLDSGDRDLNASQHDISNTFASVPPHSGRYQ